MENPIKTRKINYLVCNGCGKEIRILKGGKVYWGERAGDACRCGGLYQKISKACPVQPLRRVLGEILIRKMVRVHYIELNCEVFSCGHIQRIKRDIFGEYFAS